jgi:hypothetical protein
MHGRSMYASGISKAFALLKSGKYPKHDCRDTSTSKSKNTIHNHPNSICPSSVPIPADSRPPHNNRQKEVQERRKQHCRFAYLSTLHSSPSHPSPPLLLILIPLQNIPPHELHLNNPQLINPDLPSHLPPHLPLAHLLPFSPPAADTAKKCYAEPWYTRPCKKAATLRR